jgi:hypothetical protein
MKFVSQDGVGEYPTIILLLNRIFFRDKDRGGEHIGITMKIKEGDDVIWHHIPKEAVIGKLSELFSNENAEEENGTDNSQNTNAFNRNNSVSVESFFKLDDNLLPITNYFKSSNLYYIVKDDGLFVSEVNPFDENAPQIFFPEDDSFIDTVDNLIDILSLNDNVDLILSSSRLYSYNKLSTAFTQRFKIPSGVITSMCRLESYFVITSTIGIFLISNIESEEELVYSLVKAISGGIIDNGLNENNNFTYSLDRKSTRLNSSHS